jgi:hypothetical protein
VPRMPVVCKDSISGKKIESRQWDEHSIAVAFFFGLEMPGVWRGTLGLRWKIKVFCREKWLDRLLTLESIQSR